MLSKQNTLKKQRVICERLALSLDAVGISYYASPLAPVLTLYKSDGLAKNICIRIDINKDGDLIIDTHLVLFQSFLTYLGSDPDLFDFPASGPEKRLNKLNAICAMNERLDIQEVERFFIESNICYKKYGALKMFSFTRKDAREDELKLSPYFGIWELHEGDNITKRISHFGLFDYFAEN